MALDRAVEDLLAGEIKNLGYELLRVESFFPGRRGILRLFIDRADEPVTIEDCVRVTKAIGLVLDGIDAMPGPYNLEVSSPGSQRPLVKPAHYARFRGERARISYNDAAGARITAIGVIRGADEESVVVTVDGVDRSIPLKSILRANLQPEERARSEPAPRRRGKPGRRGKTF